MTMVYQSSAIKQAELSWAESNKKPTYRLMEKAVEALQLHIASVWPNIKSVCICCGKGNNGGDGYLLAANLKELGWHVRVLSTGTPKPGTDAEIALEVCEQMGVEVLHFSEALKKPIQENLIVDALLGSGSRGKPYDLFLKVIEAMNTSGKPILSIDVPSGVDTDSGYVGLENEFVTATETLTFGALKPGLITGRAVDAVGNLHVANIGLTPFLSKQSAFCNFLKKIQISLPPREHAAHKGDMGSVTLIGGNASMGGAIILSAEASARTGAGYVHCLTHAINRTPILCRNPGILVTDWNDSSLLASNINSSAIVIGPGLGLSEESKQIFERVLKIGQHQSTRMVIDADGLSLLAKKPNHYDHWILTPHPKEAARLLNKELVADIESDRFQTAQNIQTRYGGVCVLKGAGSIVASNKHGAVQLTVNGSGNSGMARAGMGDVLAGMLGGLMARFPKLDLYSVACLAVWMHGHAGDLAVQTSHKESVQASNLIGNLDAVWAEIY